MSPTKRLAAIVDVIRGVEARCMAVDGPVTPTLREMTEEELRTIYRLAAGLSAPRIHKEGLRGNRKERTPRQTHRVVDRMQALKDSLNG